MTVKFGRYELLERVSVGGMAEVFKGRVSGTAGFEKIVAIKRILPNLSDDQEFISMFVDEAKISANLNHSNIAQVFGFGRIENRYFIAMEYINGKDLRRIHDHFQSLNKTVPIPIGIRVVLDVLTALEYAHSRRDASGQLLGIVHRDISPQNILISYEGAVKIIDFGIAKALSRSTKTSTGNLKGKFGYMSPEQVEGEEVDARSDLFAAGTVFYELVTGKRLFYGDSELATLEKVRLAEIPPPTRVNPSIPKQLEAIVLKALARKPENRYQCAEEFHEALEQFTQIARMNFTGKQLSRWMKGTFNPEGSKDESSVAGMPIELLSSGLSAPNPMSQPSPDPSVTPSATPSTGGTKPALEKRTPLLAKPTTIPNNAPQKEPAGPTVAAALAPGPSAGGLARPKTMPPTRPTVWGLGPTPADRGGMESTPAPPQAGTGFPWNASGAQRQRVTTKPLMEKPPLPAEKAVPAKDTPPAKLKNMMTSRLGSKLPGEAFSGSKPPARSAFAPEPILGEASPSEIGEHPDSTTEEELNQPLEGGKKAALKPKEPTPRQVEVAPQPQGGLAIISGPTTLEPEASSMAPTIVPGQLFSKNVVAKNAPKNAPVRFQDSPTIAVADDQGREDWASENDLLSLKPLPALEERPTLLEGMNVSAKPAASPLPELLDDGPTVIDPQAIWKLEEAEELDEGQPGRLPFNAPAFPPGPEQAPVPPSFSPPMSLADRLKGRSDRDSYESPERAHRPPSAGVTPSREAAWTPKPFSYPDGGLFHQADIRPTLPPENEAAAKNRTIWIALASSILLLIVGVCLYLFVFSPSHKGGKEKKSTTAALTPAGGKGSIATRPEETPRGKAKLQGATNEKKPTPTAIPEIKQKPSTEEIKPKPLAKVEATPEVKPKVEVKAKATPEVKPKVEVKAKATPEAKVKVEAKAKAEAKAKVKPKAEAKVKPKAEAKVKPKAEAKVEAKAKPETKAATAVRPAPKGSTKTGFLVVASNPWARIYLDGKDTGRFTPVPPTKPLSLSPGTHQITLEVGSKRFTYPVVIKVGETGRLIKSLPVK